MRDYKKHAYVYSSDLYCEGDYEINGNDDHIYKGWHTYLNLPFPGCFIELGFVKLECHLYHSVPRVIQCLSMSYKSKVKI